LSALYRREKFGVVLGKIGKIKDELAKLKVSFPLLVCTLVPWRSRATYWHINLSPASVFDVRELD